RRASGNQREQRHHVRTRVQPTKPLPEGHQMSDLEARIAEVLEEHDFDPSRLISSIVACTCDEWALDLPQGRSRYAAHREHVAERIAALLAPALAEGKVTALRQAAEEVGAWGPACIPAARALVNRANKLDNQ